MTSCGVPEMCRCKGVSADCSRNYGRLAFIPKFPENIRFLNFSLNNLTAIPSDDFFLNITNIYVLDLSSNRLKEISRGAFKVFKSLTVLLLICNYQLTYQSLGPVFGVRTLMSLDLRHGTLPAPPVGLFRRYPLPRLQRLYLHNNHLRITNMSVFTPLRNLRVLGLSANGISFLTTDYFPQLQELNVGRNSLDSFPSTCTGNGSSLFPHLTKLILLSNKISKMEMEICLPRLRLLNLNWNHFSVFQSDQFSSTRFPRLYELAVSAMRTKNRGIQKHAFRNKMLRIISLIFNNIDFNADDVDGDSFAGCPRVITLQLSHNYFNGLSENKFIRLFGNLTKLNRLYMGNGNIQSISAKMFARFKSLARLVLYQNCITDLPDAIVDGLANLTEFDVNANRISVVRETTFSAAVRQRLNCLDLSENPFLCSCDLLWFQRWLVSKPHVFTHYSQNYSCSNLPHTNVTSFYLNEQACLLSHNANVLIISSVTLILLAMILFSPLYRYRWHIRLLLHEAFRGRGDARIQRLQAGNFEYDIFVSYASDDLPWVQRQLVPQLEGWGLRLCLHERDFIIGKNIVDNICDCVETSKKVLVVFSKHFCQSQWCQFELQFCLSHVIDFDDALVVTCLDDVGSRDLTTAMMAVLKTTTYIQWEEHPDAIASFWGRLRVSLQDILPVVEV